MPVREILLLGNPKLYQVCAPVNKGEVKGLDPVIRDLHDTLIDFRARHGIGCAIAAPQIGVLKRLVVLHIEEPVVFLNPTLHDLSEEMMGVWDDCMSFPDLLVKVWRHPHVCNLVPGSGVEGATRGATRRLARTAATRSRPSRWDSGCITSDRWARLCVEESRAPASLEAVPPLSVRRRYRKHRAV